MAKTGGIPLKDMVVSPDRQWLWNGHNWVPTWGSQLATADRERWAVRARPALARPTQVIAGMGLALLLVGFVAASVAGFASMGDPGPGQTNEPAPTWVSDVGWWGFAAIGLGALILLVLGATALLRRMQRKPEPV